MVSKIFAVKTMFPCVKESLKVTSMDDEVDGIPKATPATAAIGAAKFLVAASQTKSFLVTLVKAA